MHKKIGSRKLTDLTAYLYAVRKSRKSHKPTVQFFAPDQGSSVDYRYIASKIA